MVNVQWPANPVSQSGDDLFEPAKNLLAGLGLMSTDPTGVDAATPESHQVIKAGSLAISRTWAKIIAGGATFTAGGGLLSQFGNLDLALRLVIVGGVALILAAGAVAVALIITADVRCRSVASVARTESLAAVTTAFLQCSANLSGAANIPQAGSNGNSNVAAFGGPPSLTEFVGQLAEAIRRSGSGG